MKKCSYCKDPIKFDKPVVRTDRDGNKIYYHPGCYELRLEEIVEKTRVQSNRVAEYFEKKEVTKG